MTSPDLSRRDFLGSSTTTAIATGAFAAADSAAATTPLADPIRIGFVGVGSRGFGAHVRRLARLKNDGHPIELAAVCDVFRENRDKAASYIEKQNGTRPAEYEDHREMYSKADLHAICIATPDHWHARQTIEALQAGLDVYCEKPMTRTADEALAVMNAWKKSGRVMQVGVQSTSLPVWNEVNQRLRDGQLGKVLMYQTEFFRNSAMGQWRYYKLTKSMNPKNINWRKWLGVDDGLAEDRPFDRAVYRQWRRFWPFGAGMFTDLFVHRTTSMLKATGLRFPGRIAGAGGLYVEYDGRDVPDVATVVADFHEGVQGLVTATMACQNTPIRQLIRGHFGSFVFGNGEQFESFDYVPERPQVTRNSKLKNETIPVGKVEDTTYDHFRNWIEAMVAGDPAMCNNPTDLGAAAIITVILGAQSYREGKIFQFDPETLTISDGSSSWASDWEAKSAERQKPNHIAGWSAGDHGSMLEEPNHMKLAGPWVGGIDPAG